MWYQGTELLGWGVQPERKRRQRAAGCLQGLDTSEGPVSLPCLLSTHSQQTDRQTDRQPSGGGWFWSRGSKWLFLNTILIVNPLSLSSGTNGLSEVMEVAFQIS